MESRDSCFQISLSRLSVGENILVHSSGGISTDFSDGLSIDYSGGFCSGVRHILNAKNSLNFVKGRAGIASTFRGLGREVRKLHFIFEGMKISC